MSQWARTMGRMKDANNGTPGRAPGVEGKKLPEKKSREKREEQMEEMLRQRRAQVSVEEFLRQQPPGILAGATDLAKFLSTAVAVRVRAGDGRAGRPRVYPWTLEAQCWAANDRLARRAAAAGTAREVRRVYENYARQVSYRHLPAGAAVVLGGQAGEWPENAPVGLCSAYAASLVRILTSRELHTLGCRRKAETASPMFSWAKEVAIHESPDAASADGSRVSGDDWQDRKNRRDYESWLDHWRGVERAWRGPLERAGDGRQVRDWEGGQVRGAFLQAFRPIMEIIGAVRASTDSSLTGWRLEAAQGLLERVTVSAELLVAMVEVMDQATPAERESSDQAHGARVLLATLPPWPELEPVAGAIRPLECLCSRCFTAFVGMRAGAL